MATAGEVRMRPCKDGQIGKNVKLEVAQFPDGTTTVELQQGVAYDFSISFESASGSATLENKLTGIIAGIPVPWNGVAKNACDGLADKKCPLEAGESYTYKNQILVEKAFPTVAVTIRWQIIDAASDNQVCFELPAKIIA